MKIGWRYLYLASGLLSLYGCAAGKSYIAPQPELTREIRPCKTEQVVVTGHKDMPQFFKTTSYYDEGPILEIAACSPGEWLDKDNMLHFLTKGVDGTGISIYVKLGSSCSRCHSNGKEI